MSKIIFMKNLPTARLELVTTQNLLKFDIFNILNKPISILMSKKTFIQYLPPPRPKSVPKSKMPRTYVNFKYANFDSNVKNNIYEIFTTC